MLGVEMDIGKFFGADGLEGPETDMEGDCLDLDAALFELSENLRREVKSGGRGCC